MDSSNSGGRAHHQMTKKYGVGILGAGWVAGEYVKAFRDHPQTEVVGIWNRTRDKAVNLLQQHGVPARVYDSQDELIGDDRIQIVASVTHPNLRLEHAEKA